jgi:hypothetical protein
MYQVPHFPQSRDRRLTRNLGRVIKHADFCDFAVHDKAHIYDMIHTVNGLHVENGHDIIAIYDMLLNSDALDHRQN